MALLPVSDLEKLTPVFRGKAGNAFARFLLRILGITKLENTYAKVGDLTGPPAAAKYLEVTETSFSLQGGDILDHLPEGAFITISNHTMGGVDGLMLIDFIGSRRPDYKVMVNKMLWCIDKARGNFICVTPTGEEQTAPTAQSIGGVREAMEHLRNGHPLGLFPSGAVSDLLRGPRPTATRPDGSSYSEPGVRDREWQMPIIKFISKAKVPVVPIRFFDGNSRFYYWLGATFGWKVRLLQMPRECTNKKGRTIRIGIGPVITPEQQAECKSLEELRALLRGSVYGQTIK